MILLICFSAQIFRFFSSFILADAHFFSTPITDLGPLGNYPGSAFLPSDSDILLDSPEQDDIGEIFFAFLPI